MTVKELIDNLSHYSEEKEILLQDGNGFSYFLDFVCEDTYTPNKEDVIYLVSGQLA